MTALSHRLLLLWIALACPGRALVLCQDGERADLSPGVRDPSPEASREPPQAEAVERAIRRGVDFLVRSQAKAGCWGSARRTKELNIYAPPPGAHLALRAGVTSLCVSALAEVGDPREEAARALERGEAWLEENLPRVRRATPDTLYNCWAHAYGIQALVRMARRHADDAGRGQRLVQLIEEQIDFLRRYEAVDGGWGYLDFNVGSQKPSSLTTSFTTATVLVAFHDAKELGVQAPERLVKRAVDTIHRQQKPDFTYVYSESWKWSPMGEINRPAASLGRSQACNLALRLWGDERITDGVLRDWLERLFARNGWLDMGRKRPVPHESWFAVAGYFFYYGHYYAALCMDELPAGERSRHRVRLAEILLRLQETDGSWWDYPFYDYHQPYGTAFALMTLWRCQGATAGQR